MSLYQYKKKTEEISCSQMFIFILIMLSYYLSSHKVQCNWNYVPDIANRHGLTGHRTRGNDKDFKKPLIVVYYDVDYVKNPKGMKKTNMVGWYQ